MILTEQINGYLDPEYKQFNNIIKLRKDYPEASVLAVVGGKVDETAKSPDELREKMAQKGVKYTVIHLY